jgi:hypothetical protein
MGKRALAVKGLNQLMECFESGTESIAMNIDEPFLPLSQDSAATDPGERVPEWLYASILAHREKIRSFSSYYTGTLSWKKDSPSSGCVLRWMPKNNLLRAKITYIS